MCRQFLLCAALHLCMVPVAFAQQNQPPRPGPEDALSSSAINPAEGLIKLDVVVTDKSGKPVTGLKAEDVTLLDNGQPTKIVTFQAFDGIAAKPDPPVEVILVIDELNLPSNLLPYEKQEAERFLRQNGGHLAQPISIYRLTLDGLFASAQPSTDGNVLAEEVARDKEPRVVWQVPRRAVEGPHGDGWFELTNQPPSGTDIRDVASWRALGSIAIEERRKTGRKLLFWPSPGWPVQQHWVDSDYDFGSITEFSTRLREARVTLSSVSTWADPTRDPRIAVTADLFRDPEFIYQGFLKGVTSVKEARSGNLALDVLATQSGGDVLQAQEGLAEIITKQVEEASDFYTLTFDPARTNVVDEYHDLKVDVDKPDLTAHTRTGYYDEPVFYDQPSPAEHVTVEQLEQMLEKGQAGGDQETAKALSGLELTERMSSVSLAALKVRAAVEKSRQQLMALADRSAVLSSPAADIAASAPPDAAAQRAMLSRTVEYLNDTIARLPDFFAERTTVQYDEPTRKEGQTWKTAVGDRSLHVAETTKATVLFRNGKEVVDAGGKKGRKQKEQARNLDTMGTFGPILAGVIGGAAANPNDLTWSHWEKGANGPEAVFRYMVPPNVALFEVGFCCLANDLAMVPFDKRPGVHGEIAIDPASGAVLRLTADADLEARSPLEQSGIMVEYGPVAMGGKTYICPVRSVSLSRQRTVTVIHRWGEDFKVYGPFETILNDMEFDKYHLFRSESHILPGFTPATDQK